MEVAGTHCIIQLLVGWLTGQFASTNWRSVKLWTGQLVDKSICCQQTFLNHRNIIMYIILIVCKLYALSTV